jgi:inorganic pyrophosphatase
MDAEFWEYLQDLIASSSIVIERPQGTSHPDYPDVVYPLDYGYLKSTLTSDLGGIDVWI